LFGTDTRNFIDLYDTALDPEEAIRYVVDQFTSIAPSMVATTHVISNTMPDEVKACFTDIIAAVKPLLQAASSGGPQAAEKPANVKVRFFSFFFFFFFFFFLYFVLWMD
jgi:hypothetical protein